MKDTFKYVVERFVNKVKYLTTREVKDMLKYKNTHKMLEDLKQKNKRIKQEKAKAFLEIDQLKKQNRLLQKEIESLNLTNENILTIVAKALDIEK